MDSKLKEAFGPISAQGRWQGACPHCGVVLRVNRAESGMEVVCGSCDNEFILQGTEPEGSPDSIYGEVEEPEAPRTIAPPNQPRRVKSKLTLTEPSPPLSESYRELGVDEVEGAEESAGSYRAFVRPTPTTGSKRRKRRSRPPERARGAVSRKRQPGKKAPEWLGLVLFVVLIAVLGGGLWIIIFPILKDRPGSEEMADAKGESAEEEKERSPTPSGEEDRPETAAEAPSEEEVENRLRLSTAMAVATGALQSPSWQELLNYVRNPDEMKPRMRAYYSRNLYRPLGIESISSASRVEDPQGHDLIQVTVVVDGFDERTVYIEETAEDGFRVDWETMAQYSEMEWAEFRRQRPSDPVEFRLIISDRRAHDLRLFNKEAWQPYMVRPWDAADQSMPAYMAKDNPQAADLFALIQGRTEQGQAVIATLRYRSDLLDGNFVEIVELVQEGWVRP